MMIQGIVFVIISYLICLLLHIILPSRKVIGYCCDNNNQPLVYRLNGINIYFIMCGIFLLLPENYQVILYDYQISSLFTANIIGLIVSLFFYLRGGQEKYQRCVTKDQLTNLKQLKLTDHKIKLNVFTRFFLGHEWNPRFGNVDVKMWLYIVGAVGLQLNILSCVIKQHILMGRSNLSNAMIVYVIMFAWFIIEYLCFEEIHLYTYDLFAEKLGFKLAWGCLVFYPFFYAIGCRQLVSIPLQQDVSISQIIIILITFFSGWLITRGANLQKFYFRTNPTSDTFFFGLIKQRTIPGTRILCSGYWGLARHFNYFGEILQGLALALPGFFLADTNMYRIIPMLYPLYYSILFVTREIDDNTVCQMKYGKNWDLYCKKVKSRIIPGIY